MAESPGPAPRAARLVVVVPCFNEERRLDAAAFRSFDRESLGLRFCFVNDGSRDGTLALLRRLVDEHPGLGSVLDLGSNHGKAEAVRRGLLAALDTGASYVGFWDADLATPLDEVARLEAALAARPAAWLAMGARVQMLGTDIRRRASRHYAGRWVATRVARALRLPTYDTQCGAKLFRAATTPAAAFEAPFLTRWLFDVEVLARLVRRHLDGEGPSVADLVLEVPLRRWPDVPGSKVRPTDFFRALRGVRRIRRAYRLP